MQKKMYKKIVIGIDQSYTRTGISIAADGKLMKVTSTNFRGCKNNSEKRKHLVNIIHRIIKSNQQKAISLTILCERIRTFTGGDKLRPNYLKSTGALVATIVDTAYEYGIDVYSVDTRSWKSKIVGTCKNKEAENKKLETVEYVMGLGFDVSRVNTKGNTVYDDDAADSACIALYGFLPKNKQSLEKEK